MQTEDIGTNINPDIKNEVSIIECVCHLQGWYDNFLSGMRYYISGGNVHQFIDLELLPSYGKVFPHVKKETLRFGFYPDFSNYLLSHLKYK